VRDIMAKVFVSYSHEDSDFTDRLAEDLDFATELDLSIDKRCLRPGDSLTKIFAEIGESDFLLPVLSIHSVKSQWCQKELKVAVIKEIEESSFKIIPVIKEGEKWNELKEMMPAYLREALRDKYMCRFDTEPYKDAFQELVGALAPETSPQDIYSSIADPTGENPFRRVRAEHFRDPKTFAELFAEPEIVYDTLVSPKPTCIEGGRGSGKTMVLKSLRASIAPLIKHCKEFKEAKLSYFAAYFRATQDTFTTFDIDSEKEGADSIATGIFYDELILRLSQSVIEELCDCIRLKIVPMETKTERSLCRAILESIRLEDREAGDLESLKKVLSSQICRILDYVRARGRNEDVKYEVKSLTKDNLIQLCTNIKANVPELQGCFLCFLIDEYENLKEFQKVVLNTLIKWHNAETFTFKIATKKTGFSTAQTLEAQELEEGHDYSVIDLDFHISEQSNGERTRYERYLRNICKNIMKAEKFCQENIEKALEDRIDFTRRMHKNPDGFTLEEIRSEVIRILSLRGAKWEKLTDEQRQRAIGHFSLAAEYRLLGPRRRSYGGFNDFVLLSSGIVRVFLELCGMSYYFARQEGKQMKKGDLIEVKHQTKAVHYLSEYYLYRVNKNIEYLGPTLYDFTVDIGDIFRQKLMKHLSEPEAARLTIHDPQKLKELKVTIRHETKPREYTVKRVMDIAVMHSIFQEYGKRGGRRGKQVYAGQAYDYVLNRIFAPALQISPRPRWSTSLSSKDIQELLIPEARTKTKRKLINKVTKEVEGKTLFDFMEEDVDSDV
jgi:hypothetical protein